MNTTTLATVLVMAVGLGACGGRVTPVGQDLFDPTEPPVTTLPEPGEPPVVMPVTPTTPTTPQPDPTPPVANPTGGLAPSAGVPCGPGKTVELTYALSAGTMASGASDTTGPGSCTGSVTFFDDLSRIEHMNMAEYGDGWPSTGDMKLSRAPFNGISQCTRLEERAPHCATVVYGDGRVKPRYCTVVALCENGLARATGFTW